MKSDKSSKKSGKFAGKKAASKVNKKDKKAEKEAKRAARKGDGSFPDVLIVTKEKDKDGTKGWFLGHSEDLGTLYSNGQTVAVYKLRRVSTIAINRKVVR